MFFSLPFFSTGGFENVAGRQARGRGRRESGLSRWGKEGEVGEARRGEARRGEKKKKRASELYQTILFSIWTSLLLTSCPFFFFKGGLFYFIFIYFYCLDYHKISE